jgi:transketolase
MSILFDKEVSKMIEQIALKIRQEILKMACGANGGHIAPAFSMTDIIATLYFDGILRYDAKNPNWIDRDIFVLSKGHGVLALYAALSMAGYFPLAELSGFCKPGSRLGSLAKLGSAPGIEATTGSLGHGLSYAVGIALANKIDQKDTKTYVLLGDGECEEGSVWEGFMAACHHKLDNLVVIIDNNELQAMDSLENVLSFHNFSAKLSSFGFSVEDIDGHDYAAIKKALLYKEKDIPRAIIAHTIKGKGISFMENVPIWHYRIPDEAELEIALHELKMTKEELGHYEKCLFRNII